jgi:hypothetical protein
MKSRLPEITTSLAIKEGLNPSKEEGTLGFFFTYTSSHSRKVAEESIFDASKDDPMEVIETWTPSWGLSACL